MTDSVIPRRSEPMVRATYLVHRWQNR